MKIQMFMRVDREPIENVLELNVTNKKPIAHKI